MPRKNKKKHLQGSTKELLAIPLRDQLTSAGACKPHTTQTPTHHSSKVPSIAQIRRLGCQAQVATASRIAFLVATTRKSVKLLNKSKKKREYASVPYSMVICGNLSKKDLDSINELCAGFETLQRNESLIHITCSKLHPLVTEHSLAVAVGYQAMILPGSVPKYEFPASTNLKQAAPEVLYIHDDEQVDPICEKLISEGCLDSPSNILGLDCEFCGFEVATIQLASSTTSAVFHIANMKKVPTSLQSLLSNSEVSKITLGPRDVLCLRNQLKIDINHIDLHEMPFIKYRFSAPQRSLQNLTNVFLQEKLQKKGTHGPWDRFPLTLKQISYAALDAAATRRVFFKVASLSLDMDPLALPSLAETSKSPSYSPTIPSYSSPSYPSTTYSNSPTPSYSPSINYIISSSEKYSPFDVEESDDDKEGEYEQVYDEEVEDEDFLDFEDYSEGESEQNENYDFDENFASDSYEDGSEYGASGNDDDL